jgi:large subunit ribosomal protein LP1
VKESPLDLARRISGPPSELYTKSQEGTTPGQDSSFVEDYGVPVSRQFAGDEDEEIFDMNEEMEARLERELEGGGSDSDSSLDLHTPLP